MFKIRAFGKLFYRWWLPESEVKMSFYQRPLNTQVLQSLHRKLCPFNAKTEARMGARKRLLV